MDLCPADLAEQRMHSLREGVMYQLRSLRPSNERGLRLPTSDPRFIR
jgi:hypothetical protein